MLGRVQLGLQLVQIVLQGRGMLLKLLQAHVKFIDALFQGCLLFL